MSKDLQKQIDRLEESLMADRQRKAFFGTKKRHKNKDNPDRAERRCLGPCGQMFVSEHIGHRMCKRCRSYAESVGFDFDSVRTAL